MRFHRGTAIAAALAVAVGPLLTSAGAGAQVDPEPSVAASGNIQVTTTPEEYEGPCLTRQQALFYSTADTADSFTLKVEVTGDLCSPVQAKAVIYDMPDDGSGSPWPQTLSEQLGFTVARAGTTEIRFTKTCDPVQFDVITGAAPQVIGPPTGNVHGPLLFPGDTRTALQFWGLPDEECPSPPPGEETTTTTTTPEEETTTTTSTTTPEEETTTTTTTTTPEDETLAYEFLGPVCVNDFPYIRWEISVTGTTSTTATITLTDINDNVVQVLNDQPLTGQVIWPGASEDPPDWPGWELVDGVWVEVPDDAVLREGLTVTAEVNPTGEGFVEYPPSTEACGDPPPDDEPNIEFEFLGPLCIDKYPHVGWAIKTTGISDTTADITMQDVNGNEVLALSDQAFLGAALWPGASVNPPDHPGWDLVDGIWIDAKTMAPRKGRATRAQLRRVRDDSVLREGLTVTATVGGITRSGFVSYPPKTSDCAEPPPDGATGGSAPVASLSRGTPITAAG